ncbi:MAG: TVP38/TMEM64 family protein [Syntrophaceae bacterium]|nr:TVP38/TMEM64 family protein [Syntrophaceae bacterium]
MTANHQLLKAAARIGILILAFAIAGVLFRHYNLHIYLTNTEKGIQFINSFRPYSEIIFIILQILQVLFAPFPGEATGFIGGYIYGVILGTVYSTIGLSIGSWGAFLIARKFGMPFIEKVFKADTIKKYDYFIEHKGTYLSFILFLIPGFPKDSLCYILGLSHMAFGEFMIISSIGRLLGTIFLSASGASLRNEQMAVFFSLLIAGGLILLWGVFHSKSIMDKLHRHHKKQDKD